MQIGRPDHMTCNFHLVAPAELLFAYLRHFPFISVYPMHVCIAKYRDVSHITIHRGSPARKPDELSYWTYDVSRRLGRGSQTFVLALSPFATYDVSRRLGRGSQTSMLALCHHSRRTAVA